MARTRKRRQRPRPAQSNTGAPTRRYLALYTCAEFVALLPVKRAAK